jgi:hypothetical protein
MVILSQIINDAKRSWSSKPSRGRRTPTAPWFFADRAPRSRLSCRELEGVSGHTSAVGSELA